MYNYVNLHKHNLLTKHAIETNAARLTVHGLPPGALSHSPLFYLPLSLSLPLFLSLLHTPQIVDLIF